MNKLIKTTNNIMKDLNTEIEMVSNLIWNIEYSLDSHIHSYTRQVALEDKATRLYIRLETLHRAYNQAKELQNTLKELPQ